MSFERETISIIKSILRIYCRFNRIFCGAQVYFINVKLHFTTSVIVGTTIYPQKRYSSII